MELLNLVLDREFYIDHSKMIYIAIQHCKVPALVVTSIVAIVYISRSNENSSNLR